MKINLRFCLAVAALCTAAGGAEAQTATLSITGKITNTPCTIAADVVNLGDVPISEFVSTLAPEKYRKTFNITLSGCELSTLSTASLKFNGTTTGGAVTTLALTPGAASAQGFGVMMVANDSTHSPGATAVKFDGSSSHSFNIASNKRTYAFQAFYMKVVGSTQRPGTANATATVTLTFA
ncbi:fimbrial protein [Achromobacter sp. JUb104]|uniref:fimbrial protein n=1 Tax=Achromobacter sp. JUb104 TaxID=2940590 RepID=UPI002167E17C|nr:fimbrial protein [Achromobacter sp. JUb104]MCS3509264.1 type 1 fimbria pilin [Achromobacter sp. JUb104]